MKLLFFVFLAASTLGFFIISSFQKEPLSPKKQAVMPTRLSSSPTSLPSKEKKLLFVPYWTLGKSQDFDEEYDALIYFGITADADGISTASGGFNNMTKFLKTSFANKKYLALYMTNSTVNSLVLQNKEVQKAIAQRAVEIAKENGFDGLVFDFEITALSFESVIKNITEFYQIVGKEARKNNLPVAVTIYGDAFYRLRPYDVKTIAENVDEVLIMTYDFHKANGQPGPNFPLSGKTIYGYDLPTMIADFGKVVPKNKLTIIFGLFGYNWTLDENGKSIKQAEPVSLHQINARYISSCSFTDCVVAGDETSAETKITYKDTDGKNHVVWFEDLESMKKKEELLREQGINSLGFWAYSFF